MSNHVAPLAFLHEVHSFGGFILLPALYFFVSVVCCGLDVDRDSYDWYMHNHAFC